MKNSSDTSWDRTRQIPIFITAPKPLRYPNAVRKHIQHTAFNKCVVLVVSGVAEVRQFGVVGTSA